MRSIEIKSPNLKKRNLEFIFNKTILQLDTLVKNTNLIKTKPQNLRREIDLLIYIYVGIELKVSIKKSSKIKEQPQYNAKIFEKKIEELVFLQLKYLIFIKINILNPIFYINNKKNYNKKLETKKIAIHKTLLDAIKNLKTDLSKDICVYISEIQKEFYLLSNTQGKPLYEQLKNFEAIKREIFQLIS
jgi:hypothetical protein